MRLGTHHWFSGSQTMRHFKDLGFLFVLQKVFKTKSYVNNEADVLLRTEERDLFSTSRAKGASQIL